MGAFKVSLQEAIYNATSSLKYHIVGETCNYQVMLNFHGCLITPYLFWVHVCLSEHFLFCLCIYRRYDFLKYDFGMLISDSYFIW